MPDAPPRALTERQRVENAEAAFVADAVKRIVDQAAKNALA